MKLLERHISQQFQKNIRKHVFANQLLGKIQRIRGCFQGNTLPKPTAEVIAAWNDIPNKVVDVLPMSMKTETIFLLAPPPTPTGLVLDMDEVMSSNLSSDLSHDAGWVFGDNADSPTPDVVAFQVVSNPTASEYSSVSWRRATDQSLDQWSPGDNSSKSTGSPTLSSNPESSPSCNSRNSNTPVGFRRLVGQWYIDYRSRGAEPFIESLIAFVVASPGCASLASRIVHAVVQEVARTSHTEARGLEQAFRTSVLANFKDHWEWNNTCEESSAGADDTPPTPPATSIASFMGCLYDAGVIGVKDIHNCLSLLTRGEKRFDRLYAMHALLAQANDKLCKSRNLRALMKFKDDITSKDGDSKEFLWAKTSHSKTILADILATIERWIVSQAFKREHWQYQKLSGSGRTIRKSAIGPRLRADGRVSVAPFVAVRVQ